MFPILFSMLTPVVAALSPALANGPMAVRVDRLPTTWTGSLLERPDFGPTFAEASPGGWTGTPAPPVDNKADDRDRELAIAAQRAAKALAEHQQSPGYWLTAYTSEARFEQPHREMNTFLNALMLDVMGPIAKMADLTSAVRRTREFLSNQIEADGLVRYHGRPDAPTIGSLGFGCAITPDTDDTALVWRVAPSEHKDLLPSALATISRFRNADGLYRTWLAARDRYQCIDVGKDANPADIGIQIHLLMLLARVDPPAARALCARLQKRSDDDQIWVYYKMTPIVVLLRLADLRRIGCPLDLPQARLLSVVPGQEIWIEAIQRLQRVMLAANRDTGDSRTIELLQEIAADNFSMLQRTPPLLYHNDLTATVSRLYWSEEFGYALWLRLYFENRRAHSSVPCPQDQVAQSCFEK